jgi:hypothetical protein
MQQEDVTGEGDRGVSPCQETAQGGQGLSSPDRIRSSTERPEIEYRRAKELVAVHGLAPTATDPDAALLLEGGTTRVYRGSAGREQVGIAGPVYRQAQADPMIVPSGRILVRLREGAGAAELWDEFNHAGHEIDEVLPYAPTPLG